MGVKAGVPRSLDDVQSGRTPRIETTSSARRRRRSPLAVPDDLRAGRIVFAAEEYVVVSFRYAIGGSRAVDSGAGALTPTERAVAAAAAAGCTNLEIARARGSSLHTVANQLASIYRKLGINSRAELAAAWHSLAPDGGVASGDNTRRRARDAGRPRASAAR